MVKTMSGKLILPEITTRLVSFTDFLTLEMAMGDRKVLNIPILFDENDLEFLHQFPTTCPQTKTDIWTLALKWRYGEGLLQVSEFFSARWRSQGGKPEDVDMHDFPDEREVVFYEWKSMGPANNKKNKKALKFNFGKIKTGSLSLFYRLQDKGGLDMDFTDPIRKAAASEEELDKYITKTSGGQLYEPEDRDEPAHFNETATAAQYVAMVRNLTLWAAANQCGIITPPEQHQGQSVVKEVGFGVGKDKQFKLPTIKKNIGGYTIQVLEDVASVGRIGKEGPKLSAKKGTYKVDSKEYDVPVLGKGRFVLSVTADRSKLLKELFGYDPDMLFKDFFSLSLIDSVPGSDPKTGKLRIVRTVESIKHILMTNMGHLNISQKWLDEIIKRVLQSSSINELNMGNLILSLNPRSAMSQWGRKQAKLRTDTKVGQKGEPGAELDLLNLFNNWDILSDEDKEKLKTPVNTEQRVALIKAGNKEKNKLSDPNAAGEGQERKDKNKFWAVGFFQPTKGISRQGSQNWVDAYGSKTADELGELQMKYFSKALHILGNQYSGWISEIGGRPLSRGEKELVPKYYEDFASAMAAKAIDFDIDRTIEEIKDGKEVTSRGTNIMYGKLSAMLQKAAQTWETGQSAQDIVGRGNGEEGGETELGATLQNRDGPLSASGERKLRKGANTKLKSDVWHNKFQLSFFKRLNKNDEEFLKEHLNEIDEKLATIKEKFLQEEIRQFSKPGNVLSPEIKAQFEKSAESKALMFLIPRLETEYKFKFMAIKTAPDFAQALQMIRSLSSRGGEVREAQTLDELMDLSDYDSGEAGVGVEDKEYKTNKLKEFANTLSISEGGEELNVLDWIDDARNKGLNDKEIETKIVPSLSNIKYIFAASGIKKQDMQIYWVKAIKEIKNELFQQTQTPQTQVQSPPTAQPIAAARNVQDDPEVIKSTNKLKEMYAIFKRQPAAIGLLKPEVLANIRRHGTIAKDNPEARQMYQAIIAMFQAQGVKLEMSLPMGYPPYGNRIRNWLGNDANVWGVPNQSTGVGPTEKPIQHWVGNNEEQKKKFKSLKEYLESHKLDGYNGGVKPHHVLIRPVSGGE